MRAVLEGVAFGLRDGLDLMLAAGCRAADQIRASGGGIASPLWRQILADVLEAEIVTSRRPRARRTERHCSRRSVPAGSDRRRRGGGRACESRRSQSPDRMRAYAEAHAAYRGLYPALAPSFHA